MLTLNRPGTRNSITDIDHLRVGNAEDAKLKSGVSVLTADAPFTAAVHVMGGAPGSRETDLLAPDKSVDAIDAIVLSGGSAFGLDAASGVTDALAQAGRGRKLAGHHIPIVPSAIIFDLNNGGDKTWQQNPYRHLGSEAFHQASKDFAQGSHGAGIGATTAQVKGGLGSASYQCGDGVIVGALAVVNPAGAVLCAESRRFFGGAWEYGDEYGALGTPPNPTPMQCITKPLKSTQQNTIIAIVATNLALDKAALQRLATTAHDGLARAIVPAHTPFDGDMIFAVATAQHDFKPSLVDLVTLGHAGAMAMTRAICRGVWQASKTPSDPYPTAKQFTTTTNEDS